MGSKEDAEVVRRGYAAFSSGDMATLSELFEEDVVWHVPGSGDLSGPKQGRDATFGYFGELVSRSGGTVSIELHDVVGGDEHTIGLHRARAERDNATIEENAILVFHLRSGRVSEVWEYHEDPSASSDFWSS